ncbi:ABC transporter ATP-binding protein [Desulfolithobacter sp.]
MKDGHTPSITLEHITKFFGSVQVNRNISLAIRPGRIKALLGENGAGKSTLMSILAGRLRPDGGLIRVDGDPVRFSSARDAIKASIGMVYQHFMLVEAMTVAENVFLGQEESFFLRPSAMYDAVAELGDSVGLPVDPRAMISDLSMGERQRVEILKLLQRGSRVLIFDEPTAVLTPQETEHLFRSFRRLAAQGRSIVFISHKLDEVMSVADEIAILRKGEVVDEVEATEVASPAELARRMVGREVLLNIARRPVELHQVVLRVEELGDDFLENISLEVRHGEVLGVVGVAGNGQRELVETVCGLRRPGRGSVRILGRDWQEFYRDRPWRKGLSWIPEDRRGLATCITMDLVDNFLLTTRHGFCSGPWLHREQARKKCRTLLGEFNVQPPDPTLRARQLSGGNLQKMVLAREFYRLPRLIVAEQPTQGLDIGAIEEVWKLLLGAREAAGILLVTGDLGEALELSDRIAVMFEGKIMALFDADDQEMIGRIGEFMAGVRASPQEDEQAKSLPLP